MKTSKTMMQYSQVDTTTAKPSTKRSINNFQQFYVNKKERQTKLYEWSCRALRIKFLATLMKSNMTGEIKAEKAFQIIQKSQETTSMIKEAGKLDTQKIRTQLLAHAQTHIPHYKELRGKPAERVLWQVLTPNNIDEIAEIIQNSLQV